jgi:hypothetical protein
MAERAQTPAHAATSGGAATQGGAAIPGRTTTAAHADPVEAGKSAPQGGVAPPDLTRARELTAAALAYDGPGIRRLDRQQAGVYLPFEID